MSALPVPSDAGGVDPQASRFVRIAAVRQMTGLGRSTIYRLVAACQFPPPVQLSSRAVGWRLSDLEQWSRARKPTSH
ncbi:AlpA family transcriptional regulator [Paucibacter sp. JuS9]|uniref:helix-turn-helix transcriptional regulator n=1 Tax=Roseateles TaxID=93681 RepID=UPI002FE55EDD